jgi:hypothetical protein
VLINDDKIAFDCIIEFVEIPKSLNFVCTSAKKSDEGIADG